LPSGKFATCGRKNQAHLPPEKLAMFGSKSTHLAQIQADLLSERLAILGTKSLILA
jgi:hypothetical protein